MTIDLDDKTHTYFVNGEVVTTSVTELLQKHGLATDYSGVNKAVLSASREFGKAIHKELESIINLSDYKPTTRQGEIFAEWVKENLDCGIAEQRVAFESNGFVLAGTADLFGISKTGELILIDYKNTEKINKEAVTWQVSLLDYIARRVNSNIINERPFKWQGAQSLYCFQFSPNTAELTVHKLDKIDDSEIERLIGCEIRGEKYQRPNLVVDKELESKYIEAENALSVIMESQRVAEENVRVLRSEICKLFQEQGITKWETPLFNVTYVAGYDRVGLDTKKIKDKYPTVYNDCQKVTAVKASLRITSVI